MKLLAFGFFDPAQPTSVKIRGSVIMIDSNFLRLIKFTKPPSSLGYDLSTPPGTLQSTIPDRIHELKKAGTTMSELAIVRREGGISSPRLSYGYLTSTGTTLITLSAENAKAPSFRSIGKDISVISVHHF
jgi:hypothetical protein